MGDLVQDRVADFPLIVQSDQQSAHSDGLAPVVAAAKTTRCSIEPELPVVQLVQTHVQEGQARGVV
jgi:hypothetical protein